MIWRRAVKHWDEQDVHTGWRKLLCFTQRPGVTKQVKRRTNRRERRELDAEKIRELRDYYDNHCTADEMGGGVWEE